MGFHLFRSRRAFEHEDRSRPSAHIRLERDGHAHIRRMAAAIESVPWTNSLLSLLWFGGPVTIAGALGGYYLGYGHLPTMGNLIFFFFFAVVTGASGIISTILSNYRRAGRYRRAAQRIARVMSALPDLIHATRNLAVESLEGDARQREAATLLLRRPDLSPAGLELAAQELLGDERHARLLVDIDVYRRQGLFARIQDLYDEHHDELTVQLSALDELAPEAASLLRDRFQGRAPQLYDGVPRTPNFIENILAAIEEDDDLLMTMKDVEEMLVLAFELVNGRELPTLMFEYKGQWRRARMLDALERARSRYRIAQATGLSRLRALSSYLAEQSDTLVEDTPAGLRSDVLLERTREAMDDLAQQILQQADMVSTQRHHREMRQQLRTRARTLSNATRLFRHMRHGYEQTGRHHAQLLRLSERWDNNADSPRLHLKGPRSGLRIREDSIALADSDKAIFHRKLVTFLDAEVLPRLSRDTQRPFTADTAKRLAIEIAVILEPMVHLSHPEVQRAIYATHAADFSPIEPHLSGASKAALGAALVSEVRDDLSRSAESLALALVRHYRIELEEDTIDFLHQHYGARRNMLTLMSKYDERQRRPVSLLTQGLPSIGPSSRTWYRALVRARHVLG